MLDSTALATGLRTPSTPLPPPYTVQHRHPILGTATHDETARMNFIINLVSHVGARLAPAMPKVYARRVEPAFKKAKGRDFANTAEVREAMRADPVYQSWAALRRMAQEMRHQSGRSIILRQIDELEARIRAHLRRAHGQAMTTLRVGSITFDTNTRLFTISGTPLSLTPRERAVLEVLIRRAGSVVAKEALAAAIFGFNEDADPSAIEIYVHRIRKKVVGSGIEISTLRGLGYMLRGK